MRAAKVARAWDYPRAARLLKRTQGRIRVESTVGVGTAFTLKLPVAKTDGLPSSLPLPRLGIPTVDASAMH